jgi:hypothetical protein
MVSWDSHGLSCKKIMNVHKLQNMQFWDIIYDSVTQQALQYTN